MKPIHVLLIEDSPLYTQLVQSMLSEEKVGDFELDCEENLSAGLQRLKKGGIDAVLLDLSLPECGGLETLERVQAEAAETPVVIFTGLDDEPTSLEALNRGAADYLVKSEVNANWLRRSLMYAVQRSHLERPEDAPAAAESAAAVLRIDAAPDAEETLVAKVGVTKLLRLVVLDTLKEKLLRVLKQGRCRRLLLDFAEVEYISNATISTLLIVNKRARSAGVQLVLCNVSPSLFEQFSSRHFDKVLEIHGPESDSN